MQVVAIRVKGYVDWDWSSQFAGLRIAHDRDGCTLLTGAIRDQAALYGLLSQLSNMGLQLVSLSSDGLNNVGKVEKAPNEESKRHIGDY